MPDPVYDSSTEQSARIEIRLSRPQQLFNSLDPSPFHERDLDQDAEEYIVDSADEYPLNKPLTLIHLPADQHIALRQLVLAVGRGLTAEIADEGLYIVGWVAMWRPLEIFLYDWRPIRHRMRLFAKLSQVPVIVRSE
jgi:hypothetical protein